MPESRYYPVVIQYDSRTIKAGISGDPTPSVTAQVDDPRFGYEAINNDDEAIFIPFNRSHVITDDELIAASKNNRIWVELSEFYTDDLLSGRWFVSYDVLLELTILSHTMTHKRLLKVIKDLYTQDLLVDADKSKAVIPLPMNAPRHVQASLCKTLFTDIGAKSVIIIPDCLAAAVSAGAEASLVIDLGWDFVTVSPVFDLRCLFNLVRTSTKASGKKIHYAILKRLLQHRNKNAVFDLSNKLLVFRLIQEIIHLASVESEEEPERKINGINVPKEINRIITDIILDSEPNPDEGEKSAVQLVLDVVASLPVDLRKPLASKIIFTGPISEIRGVKAGIMKEIRAEYEGPLKFSSIIALGTWAGGSIYSSTRLMTLKTSANEIQREEYLRGNTTIKDWTDRLYS